MNRPPDSSDIHAFVDGELGSERRVEVERWLASDPEAAAEARAWTDQNDALKRAFGPVLNEPVPARLDPTRLARALPGLDHRDRRRPLVAGIAFLVGGIAGAALLALVQQGPWRAQPVAADPSARLVVMAADAHRVFTPEVRHPVEVGASEESHLVQWLSKRLGYPIGLPDLGNEGLKLVGGRLLSNAPGAAAMFMYESASGDRVTIVCSRMTGARDSAFRFSEGKGLATAYWFDDQIGFAVSGPLDRERLLRVSRRVFEAMERHGEQAS
jgi:anti-sigma factor RsiW